MYLEGFIHHASGYIAQFPLCFMTTGTAKLVISKSAARDTDSRSFTLRIRASYQEVIPLFGHMMHLPTSAREISRKQPILSLSTDWTYLQA